jgi:hypothetical protein
VWWITEISLESKSICAAQIDVPSRADIIQQTAMPFPLSSFFNFCSKDFVLLAFPSDINQAHQRSAENDPVVPIPPTARAEGPLQAGSEVHDSHFRISYVSLGMVIIHATIHAS